MADRIEEIKDAEVPTRRVRMLMVNPTDFMFLFTKGLTFRKRAKLLSGVPEDAVLVQVAHDPARGGIMMVVESEEYDETPINVMPPIQIVEIEQGVKGATKKGRK